MNRRLICLVVLVILGQHALALASREKHVPLQVRRHQAIGYQKNIQQYSTVNSTPMGNLEECFVGDGGLYSGVHLSLTVIDCNQSNGPRIMRMPRTIVDILILILLRDSGAIPQMRILDGNIGTSTTAYNGNPENYCRNPKHGEGCYTTYEDTRSENCSIQDCISTSSFTTPLSETDMAHFTTRHVSETSTKTPTFTTNSSTIFLGPNITTESILSTTGHNISTSVEPDREICPDDYIEIGTQCVKMTNIRLNWDQAKLSCEENDAQLVSLMYPMTLRDYVIEHFPKSRFWVGGRYYRNPDGWQWLSGAPFHSSFPWGINDSGQLQGNGTNNKKDCMILRYFPIQDEQVYVDNRCQKKNNFICEKPKVKIETDYTIQTITSESLTTAIIP